MIYFTAFFYNIWTRAKLIILLISIFSQNVMSLPDDTINPIDIAADSVEIDEGQSTSSYSGKVEANQGSMHLLADHVVVQHQPSRQPSKIIATGTPVLYRQKEQNGQEVKAEAGRMEYDILKEEIVLIGDARLARNHDSFSSDRIFYDKNRGVIKAGTSAQGHKRVRISIMPSIKSKPPVDKIQPKENTPLTAAPIEENSSSSKSVTKNRSSKTSTKSSNRR